MLTQSFVRGESSFTFVGLMVRPDWPGGDSAAWTFELKDGYDIVWWADTSKWTVSWIVDGIDVSLDIHAADVWGVNIGPKELSVDSSRTQG